MDGVVAGHDRGIGDLFEGVLARLAALELDEIEDLVLALEDQVVEAQEDLRPLGERAHRPILLREAQARLGEDDILRRRAREGADQGLVEGRADLDGVSPARSDDQAGERRQPVEDSRPPGYGVGLGGR